jgi:hypothetical protein
MQTPQQDNTAGYLRLQFIAVPAQLEQSMALYLEAVTVIYIIPFSPDYRSGK